MTLMHRPLCLHILVKADQLYVLYEEHQHQYISSSTEHLEQCIWDCVLHGGLNVILHVLVCESIPFQCHQQGCYLIGGGGS